MQKHKGLKIQMSLFLPRATLFHELLFRRTNIATPSQELLYEGRRLVLDPNRQAQSFPRTSQDNPIMLVSRELVAIVGLLFEDRKSLLFPIQNAKWFCLVKD